MESNLDYAACYCEENVYKLLEQLGPEDGLFDMSYAVVKSSFNCDAAEEKVNDWNSVVPYRSFARWNFIDDIFYWDYHVIVVAHCPATGKWYVIDLDSCIPGSNDVRLGAIASRCIELELYTSSVLFFDSVLLGSELKSIRQLLDNVRYRIIKRDDYLRFLCSDRSHMLTKEGIYSAPLPPWPAINALSYCARGVPVKNVESTLMGVAPTIRENNLVCLINMSNTASPGTIVDRYSFGFQLLLGHSGRHYLMLQQTDGTVGYFNDVPYFTPVETAVFYDAVRSCRLHRLPAHLMIKPRSISFFMKPDCSLARVLERNDGGKKERSTRSTAILPELQTDFSASRKLHKITGGDFITIREGGAVFGDACDTQGCCAVEIGSLNLESIDKVWAGLLFFLNGCGGSGGTFVVHNVDTLTTYRDASCEYLLSLLVVGIASILHFYSRAGDRDSLLSNVSVEFRLLSSDTACRVADKLQCFMEQKMKLAVFRTREDNFCALCKKFSSMVSYLESSSQDWMSTTCNEVVEAHETLCDQPIDDVKSDMCRSPVILVVVPRQPPLRITLEKQMLDSYTTEPLRVQSDLLWTKRELEKDTPIVFVCDSRWLVKQMTAPKGDGILTRMRVKLILHGGFCEIGSCPEEELLRIVIALKSCGVEWEEMRFVRHSIPSFSYCDTLRDSEVCNEALKTCASALLLMFRRFTMPFSPSSKQPFSSFPHEAFISSRAAEFHRQLTKSLQLSGVLAPDTTSSRVSAELTSLGRFLSYRYRLSDATLIDDALSVTDGKAIIWSFLFRHPLSVPEEIIKKCHPFHSWVHTSLLCFCEAQSLEFSADFASPRTSLVEQLALFGFGDGILQNRTHYLLSSPSGFRKALKSHLTTVAPTVCRGWYAQAPLNAGLALEKTEVSVLCAPPQSVYCELEAVERDARLRIQCPLELSYPLLIVHSILHISLHNICVFCESAEPSVVAPLPCNLLESRVISCLLEDDVQGNAGHWLDGVMNEITATLSDSALLAPLTLKGKEHMQYCERELFTRKRRRAVTNSSQADDSDLFKGVLPRSAAERSAVEELAELIKAIGREKAEKAVRGKKGFSFLEPSHELHAFYLYNLKL